MKRIVAMILTIAMLAVAPGALISASASEMSIESCYLRGVSSKVNIKTDYVLITADVSALEEVDLLSITLVLYKRTESGSLQRIWGKSVNGANSSVLEFPSTKLTLSSGEYVLSGVHAVKKGDVSETGTTYYPFVI